MMHEDRRAVAKALRELKYVVKERMTALNVRLCHDRLLSAAQFLDEEQDVIERFFSSEKSE